MLTPQPVRSGRPQTGREEQSIPTGAIVAVVVEGEDDLFAARVLRARRATTEPHVEVFIGDQMATFWLSIETTHTAYWHGAGCDQPRFEVRVGATAYVLEPIEH